MYAPAEVHSNGPLRVRAVTDAAMEMSGMSMEKRIMMVFEDLSWTFKSRLQVGETLKVRCIPTLSWRIQGVFIGGTAPSYSSGL